MPSIRGRTTEWYAEVVAFTPEMLAKIEAQRAYFASDELIRERASVWRDASPQECLAATHEECETASVMLARLEPEVRERSLQPEALPPDTETLLMHLWSQRHR